MSHSPSTELLPGEGPSNASVVNKRFEELATDIHEIRQDILEGREAQTRMELQLLTAINNVDAQLGTMQSLPPVLWRRPSLGSTESVYYVCPSSLTNSEGNPDMDGRIRSRTQPPTTLHLQFDSKQLPADRLTPPLSEYKLDYVPEGNTDLELNTQPSTEGGAATGNTSIRVELVDRHLVEETKKLPDKMPPRTIKRRRLTNPFKRVRSKLESSKMTLEGEKAALDLQVKDLTFKLEMREGHITKKETELRRLEKELKEARNVIAEVETLEAQLRRQINELEDEKQENIVKLHKLTESLEEEKAALDKCVKELTFKLDVRVEDLGKKEKHVFILMKDLEEAQKVVEEAKALEPVLRQKIDELENEKKDLMESNVHLQGQLTESHRVEDRTRNELEACRLKSFAAEKEKNRAEMEKKHAEEKCLKAYNQVDKLREVEKKHSTLQGKVSHLEKENSSLHGQLSDLETAKSKLQASQMYAEELEAERDVYKGKLSDSNEFIMQCLRTQDKQGSPKHLPVKTEFHAMMEFVKVFYDKSSKQSEQTAEENQRLLAMNSKLKEKVQEMAKASQALQEKLSEKQQFLDKQQREITALREKLSSLQEIEAVPVPLPSDVADVTDDEGLLQQLCYMPTGIKQLLIGPNGGKVILGSGDASLEFPSGAVTKETSVRYAIILHGPFVFPSGYKPGSVVVYLNMNGATLEKPVLLYLSHWSITKKGDDKDVLKFLRAPHTLEKGQQTYVFEEHKQESDLTTRTNVGVLTIQEPQCLHCLVTGDATTARYSTITFSRYMPSDDSVLFRIQFMCDSIEWNENITSLLQDKKWEKTSNNDAVNQFQFANGQQQFTARPRKMTGPGWEAGIDGCHAVVGQDFLALMGKSSLECQQEVSSGRFPPCIVYKIIYSSPEERRVKRALMTVDVDGANVPLSFHCLVKEEMPASPSPRISSPEHISYTGDVIEALSPQLDAQWRDFGTRLRVEPAIMDSIHKDKLNVRACMLQLVEKWLYREDGTGDLPRTWKAVVQAVEKMGRRPLAQKLAQQYGVQLSGL